MGINRLKDPPTWLKVATILEKPPTITHQFSTSYELLHKHVTNASTLSTNYNRVCSRGSTPQCTGQALARIYFRISAALLVPSQLIWTFARVYNRISWIYRRLLIPKLAMWRSQFFCDYGDVLISVHHLRFLMFDHSFLWWSWVFWMRQCW